MTLELAKDYIQLAKQLGVKHLTVGEGYVDFELFAEEKPEASMPEAPAANPVGDLKARIADQIGGLLPEDIHLPTEWVDAIIGPARERIAKEKAKGK
jgi:isopropylmalate/homocitrate/citramalate synthase